jgi:hypothetical protein
MANVIYLKDRAPAARRPARSETGDMRMGRILLFTGVRYERLTPAYTPTTNGPKRAKP